ncbi:MAG: helix-turn-helix transcriptional regulator [Alphaproteobacteria bacterium]|nr:helix-turn-helix transcriptional regulator [Alphaproteobacteria bacterium]
MSLGVRIAELRRNKGESLQMVADAVGVSKAHIWELEKERTTNPAMDLVRRLANHFDTTVSFFVGEDIDGTDDELQLARMFREARKLDAREREILDGMMKTLLAQKNRQKAG